MHRRNAIFVEEIIDEVCIGLNDFTLRRLFTHHASRIRIDVKRTFGRRAAEPWCIVQHRHHKVPALTDKEYYVRGCTALLDAVGRAIHHIGNIHKYARKEDVPEKTLFVITTDGMENASREYTYERVRHMIERQEKKYGWEFLFLGANIDAAAEARRFGIDADHAVDYHSDSDGTALNYEVLSETVREFRACGAVPAQWKERIDEDYKNRK